MSHNSKRVLISSNLYRPNIGGAENSLYNLALEYEKLGYFVDVVSSDMNNVTDEKLPLVEKFSDRITVYRYKADHAIVPRTFYMYKTAFCLYRKLMRMYRYEYLFVRSHFNVITAWLAGMRDIRFLLAGVVINQRANERASLSQSKLQLFKRSLDNFYHHSMQKLAVKLASRLMVFSQNMVDQLVNVFGCKPDIPIVKPGVDLQKFSLVTPDAKRLIREKLGIPLDKTILLGLGRFVQSKGYDQVIKALSHLSDDYVFLVVGKGVERQTYIDLANELGVQDKLMFAPPTDVPEQYYQLADIFMMTSVYETLGQTTLEAQACGLPVIAFEPSENIITATREITKASTSLFCTDNDAKQLAQTVTQAKLKLEDNTFNAREINSFIEENFSWRALALTIEDTH